MLKTYLFFFLIVWIVKKNEYMVENAVEEKISNENLSS